MKIEVAHFGEVNGVAVKLFTLKNENNITVKFTNYGGVITSIETPDKNKTTKNITLGFETLETYLSDAYLNSYPYFGALIGRVGNRVGNSEFMLDGELCKVSANMNKDQLHGGFIGFDRVVWKVKSFQNAESIGVELSYLSVDGEEGYPGNLEVKVIYSLNNDNEFLIEYLANTDKSTPVNLTQHAYFNLGNERSIENHDLIVNSDEYHELSKELIPTGKVISVENTPYDFRNKKRIGAGIEMLGEGFDRNFCLNNSEGNFIKVAELSEKDSARKVEVYTTEIGMQLYTGNHNPIIEIDEVEKFGPFSGVALETQHFPDSVNNKHFPSTILRPGANYYQKTMYKFSAL